MTNYGPNWEDGLAGTAGTHLGTVSVSDLTAVLYRLRGTLDPQRHKALNIIKGLPSAREVPSPHGKNAWIADAADVWARLQGMFTQKQILNVGENCQQLVQRSLDYCLEHQIQLER